MSCVRSFLASGIALFGCLFSFPVFAAETIDAKTLSKLLAENPQVQFIDVREKWEVETAKIPNSKHIPLVQLSKRMKELDPQKTTVTYCHVGNRSAKAAQLLKEKGFVDVKSLSGGIDAYSVEVDPKIPRY